MASLSLRFSVFLCFTFLLCTECWAKFNENKTYDSSAEVKSAPKKQNNIDGAAMMFADEFKQTLERYLFGICPPTFKMVDARANKKNSTAGCELDLEQQELPGRLATLALRAHSASRVDCSRLGVALANTLGELARTAANRHQMNAAHAAATDAKKRKLSKSQKAKIQAKQRTALAVKKKAAALAAAAAAKQMPS